MIAGAQAHEAFEQSNTSAQKRFRTGLAALIRAATRRIVARCEEIAVGD